MPQADKALRQQPQAPTREARRRSAASKGNQVCLLVAVQLALVAPHAALRRQSGRQSPLDECLAGAVNGYQAHIQGSTNLLIGPGRASLGGICLQQDTGAGQLTGGRLALVEQLPQTLPLLVVQRHSIFLVHGVALSGWPGPPPLLIELIPAQPFNPCLTRHYSGASRTLLSTG